MPPWTTDSWFWTSRPGNPQAFVEIHRRYGALARHVCQRFLPQQQDVDEAFQETMIRVFQGLYRFNGRYALQPCDRPDRQERLARHPARARTEAADGRLGAGERRAARSRATRRTRSSSGWSSATPCSSVMADLPETHRGRSCSGSSRGARTARSPRSWRSRPRRRRRLIHRAKGSFRRLWLEKVADRGGLMGFAFLPLLWLAQARTGSDASRIGWASRRRAPRRPCRRP